MVWWFENKDEEKGFRYLKYDSHGYLVEYFEGKMSADFWGHNNILGGVYISFLEYFAVFVGTNHVLNGEGIRTFFEFCNNTIH